MLAMKSKPIEQVNTPVQSTNIVVEGLNAWYGSFLAIKDISLEMLSKRVTALIGPSGCGKSTFLRCLNRMHETQPSTRVAGRITVDGVDIYGRNVDPVVVRRKIGMVFQRPNPFPTMSVYDNVVAGLKLNGFFRRGHLDDVVERALTRAGLWNEVKDKLKAGGTALSGGQQQRLCIARALAVEPEVLLMDEPASALDPVATAHIEDLIRSLREEVTIIIVTHNMQQAARVSDKTAFFMMNEQRSGELVEYGETGQIFTNPQDERTEAYITGRFG